MSPLPNLQSACDKQNFIEIQPNENFKISFFGHLLRVPARIDTERRCERELNGERSNSVLATTANDGRSLGSFAVRRQTERLQVETK
jgi:6-phosphogluconolactonase (cycloisomerase 2 family)